MGQYQQPYPYYPPPPPVAQSTSGWAIFSLIAGILSYLGVFGLGGVAAIIAGYIAKNEINTSGGRVGGRGLANTGLVLGWINVAVICLGACAVIGLSLAGIISIPILGNIIPTN
jgi:hypothetical protein